MSDFINEGDFETREAWLMQAIENMRPMFLEAVGEELPEKIRVSTGWTKRARKGSIGWTWISGAAEDKINNVFISPEISDSVEVLGVLLHELIHVWDDCEHGHTGAFKQAWAALGFTGKATCSTPGEELRDSLEAMTVLMGDYPHAKMLTGAEGGKGTMPKKQGTRMIKVTCEDCGYTVRTTKKWLEVGNPHCPAHGEMIPEPF